jgi:uncharacterized protein
MPLDSPIEPCPYSPEEQAHLLALARASIGHGLEHERPIEPVLDAYPEGLRVQGASFVTLQLNGLLRGCIGTLEAERPLAADVAHNAYAAAFRDPRFPALAADEAERLEIAVSVLGPLVAVQCTDERELLAQLRPGVDGLVLIEGQRRSTFLPAVWEDLPDPRLFLDQLRTKAGLPPDYWSDSLQVLRYSVYSIR